MPQLVTERESSPAQALRATPLADTCARPARSAVTGERSPVEVSVCIVNRDCRQFLRACLVSLLRQPQGTPFEVIVVDNGSRDGAPDMVEREFPEVRLIRNKRNLGFSRGNNQAAAVARGRHLFFLNNDTELAAGTLAELVEFQANHPEAWLIGPRLRGTDGKEQRGRRRFPTVATFLHRTCLFRWTGLFRRRYQEYCRRSGEPGFRAAGSPRAGEKVEVLMGAALFARRDRFAQIGGWSEEFFFGGEDLELCLRANAAGAVIHVPMIEILHHGRACTRRFIGQATRHIAAGFVKYLRKKGTSRLGMLGYKTALTLDTPLQIGLKTGQLAWQLLRGRWTKAGKCWNDLKGLLAFSTRGMWEFWRA
ncbi:MAG: glycosyltransferase family 2 protein [Gemmataceae bacterium]